MFFNKTHSAKMFVLPLTSPTPTPAQIEAHTAVQFANKYFANSLPKNTT